MTSAASLHTQFVSWLHAATPSLPAALGNTESIHPKVSGPLGVLKTSSQDVSRSPVLAPREVLRRLKQGCEFQARTQGNNPTRKMKGAKRAAWRPCLSPQRSGGRVGAWGIASFRGQTGQQAGDMCKTQERSGGGAQQLRTRTAPA